MEDIDETSNISDAWEEMVEKYKNNNGIKEYEDFIGNKK